MPTAAAPKFTSAEKAQIASIIVTVVICLAIVIYGVVAGSTFGG